MLYNAENGTVMVGRINMDHLSFGKDKKQSIVYI